MSILPYCIETQRQIDRNFGHNTTKAKQSIDKYIEKIISENISDESILCDITFDGFEDDFIDQKRIYKFSDVLLYKYAIAIPFKQLRYLEILGSKPAKPTPPNTIILKENFELFNIFYECKFCNKKHLFFNFGFKNKNDCICKKCCTWYDIFGSEPDKLNRFKVVDNIRQTVKEQVRNIWRKL